MNVVSQLGRFGAVGAIGFVVDAGILQLLIATTALGPYAGRLFSYLAAATVTWLLNRVYTFDASNSTQALHAQWLKYVAVNGIGGAINYAVYYICVAYSEWMHAHLFVGVAAGAAVALLFNFCANRTWVFQRKPA